MTQEELEAYLDAMWRASPEECRWADPVEALIMVPIIAREGVNALR
jgi:hypothetical protein